MVSIAFAAHLVAGKAVSTASSEHIRGIVIPLPTVFDPAGEFDEGTTRRMAAFYVDAGANALFLLGSYGQGPALAPDERMRVAEAVMAEVGGRLPVIVHVGSVDPYTTTKLGRHAREIGAAAVAIVGPYYYADRSEDELLLHFEMVDQAIRLPILLYNNPRYQGYEIGPELVRRLRAVAPNVFGAKLAMGTLEDALAFIEVNPWFAPFALIKVLTDGIPRGVRGSISPPITLAPELGIALLRAIDQGRDDAARTLQAAASEVNDTMLALARRYGRTPYLEGLRALGFPIRTYPRWPTVPMPEDERRSLLEMLAHARDLGMQSDRVPVAASTPTP